MLSQGLRHGLTSGEPVYSFEFFPPKTDAGERQLWQAIADLAPLQPTFVSVTYGAGGSTRDRTVRITSRILNETGMDAVAHLTCVGLDGGRAARGARALSAGRDQQPAGAAR